MNPSVTSESKPTSKPQVSERKASANRANAKRSTGPRTPAGKARSSLNALRHGILAKAAFNLVIEGDERRAEFEALVAGLAQEFQPRTMSEHMTVQQLAGCYWRLAKVWTYEQEAAWRGWTTPMPLEEFNEYEEHYQVAMRQQVLKNQNEFFPLAGLGLPTIPNGASARTILRYQGAVNAVLFRCLNFLERRRKERTAEQKTSEESFEELDYINEPTTEAPGSPESEPEASPEKPTEEQLHKRTQKSAANAPVSSKQDARAENPAAVDCQSAAKTPPEKS
jgi:hypothetical protein